MGNLIYIVLGMLVLIIAISYIYYEQVYLDESIVEEHEANGSVFDDKSDSLDFGFTKRELFIYFGLLGVGFIFAVVFFLFKSFY